MDAGTSQPVTECLIANRLHPERRHHPRILATGKSLAKNLFHPVTVGGRSGITQEKNSTLPDLDMRERGILFLMAAVILWMGIGSPFFTRRTETSTQNVLQLMQRPARAYDAGVNSAPADNAAKLVNSK